MHYRGEWTYPPSGYMALEWGRYVVANTFPWCSNVLFPLGCLMEVTKFGPLDLIMTNTKIWLGSTTEVLLSVDYYFPWPQTYDGYSALHTQCIWMGESWVWSVNPECRVLTSCPKFGAWPKTYDDYSALIWALHT